MNPAPAPPLIRPFIKIFLDQEGLRPIWSLLLFFAIWFLLRRPIFPIAFVLFPLHASQDHLVSPRLLYISQSAALFCVLTATWIMSRLEFRSISTYGFTGSHSLRNFITGLATGTTLLSLLVFCLHRFHLLVFDSRLLPGTSIFRYAIIWAIGFLLVALFEESFLRAYLQFTLTRAFAPVFRRLTPRSAKLAAFWTSALILSIAFGAIHRNNPGESPIGLLAASLIGLIFCFSLWRTGSLWWAIGFHAAWDWSQSFLYGVADSGILMQGHLFATHPTGPATLSGGPTGPEGSALIFPILLAAFATVFLAHPQDQSPSS